jgi:SP family general alpha glucoside:H+ symporter-like MFS transporter
VILIGTVFAPESPWWLVRHERREDAKRALLRLTRRGDDFNADNTVVMVEHTNAVEKHLNSGLSYVDCFKGSDLRRTEVACMVWITQVLCGLPMIGYATYLHVQAGFSDEKALISQSVCMAWPS